MNKDNKIVAIKVSRETRDKLKIKAIKYKMSMMKLLEIFSKKNEQGNF